MKTIQVTTTNLFYYMAKHDEYREKLFKEILPPVERVKDNIMEEFDYDTVMEFDYLQRVFYETMRIEPPVMAANAQYSTVDITIGKDNKKLDVPAGLSFMMHLEALHHHPETWKQHMDYIPDRFNNDSDWSKTPEGKPRSSLAFNPFLGGKRICLGKSFAEVVFRFTLPLIYHHVSIDFTDADKQRAHKDRYGLGCSTELKLPMKVTIKNEVKLPNE